MFESRVRVIRKYSFETELRFGLRVQITRARRRCLLPTVAAPPILRHEQNCRRHKRGYSNYDFDLFIDLHACIFESQTVRYCLFRANQFGLKAFLYFQSLIVRQWRKMYVEILTRVSILDPCRSDTFLGL